MSQKPNVKKSGALSTVELAQLRNSLLNKRGELLAELTRGSEDLGAAREPESEEMDRAEATLELDNRAQRSSRESALLEEIEAALRRFEDGTYGFSVESGDPIDVERLRAVPWARRTAREEEAQEQHR